MKNRIEIVLLGIFIFSSNCNTQKKEYTASQIKECISGNKYIHSQFNADAIITFGPDGAFSSTSYYKNGDVREGASGSWELINKNTIVRKFNPNPFNASQDEISVEGCNRIIIGSTTYYKK